MLASVCQNEEYTTSTENTLLRHKLTVKYLCKLAQGIPRVAASDVSHADNHGRECNRKDDEPETECSTAFLNRSLVVRVCRNDLFSGDDEADQGEEENRNVDYTPQFDPWKSRCHQESYTQPLSL